MRRLTVAFQEIEFGYSRYVSDQADRVTPESRARFGDYARDVLAVLFLLLPLGMAWDLDQVAVDYGSVVPVTLLSILSLALPYLSAASILPKALTRTRLRVARVLANVPYLVVVVATLVRAYVADTSAGGVADGGGVGMGVVFGLVGAILAAQGRAAEQRAGLTDGALWRAVTVVLTALGVVLAVASAGLFVAEYAGEPSWSAFVVLGLDVVFFAGVPLIAVSGFARGDGVWRDVTVAIGVVGLVVAVWAQGAEETMGSAWSLRLAGPQILLWPALGAAAAAPGVAGIVSRARGAVRWVNVAGRLFQMVALVAVLAMLISGFRLINDVEARGVHITGIVLSLVVIVAATFGRSALIRDARSGRPGAVGAAGILVVVMIVQTTLIGAAQSVALTVDMATILSLWLVFAGAIVLVLTAPSSVRAEFEPQSARSPAAVAPTSPRAVPAEDESIWETGPDARDSG